MTGSNDETFTGVADVVRSAFRLSPAVSISADTTSADVDGWDSLSHSILIMQIEERFGIELPMDRAFALANVGELAELVRETVAGGHGT
jgi:acyl carrier protein